MSFAAPLILLALIAIPALVFWYVTEQRRRERAAAAFVAPILTESVAPQRPRWRRHLPVLAFLIALAVLIFAAARPERTVAVPVNDAAVMLVNDTSSSMQAKDVKPTRLGAAEHAGRQFLTKVPSSVKVGLIAFNTTPTLLQSPTTDHQEVSSALSQLVATGHTAIGDALLDAQRVLLGIHGPGGKHVPAAIVLVSDGYSTQGTDPLVAARQARNQHIPIYTISLGTAHGTLPFKRGGRVVQVVVPPSPQALAQIATASGGQAFTVTDTAKLSAVYTHLAKQLSHKNEKHEMTASLAGGGLLLLLIGSGLSLLWFGRLI
jgi:Ca-activated chloride channel family protein